MKNVFAFLLMLALSSSFTLDLSAQDSKKVIGDWSFNVPQSEYYYQKGTLTIYEQESLLKGSVTFTSGEKATLEHVKFEKDELTFELSVEYELIKVTMNLKENMLKGVVQVEGSELPITAERKK